MGWRTHLALAKRADFAAPWLPIILYALCGCQRPCSDLISTLADTVDSRSHHCPGPAGQFREPQFPPQADSNQLSHRRLRIRRNRCIQTLGPRVPPDCRRCRIRSNSSYRQDLPNDFPIRAFHSLTVERICPLTCWQAPSACRCPLTTRIATDTFGADVSGNLAANIRNRLDGLFSSGLSSCPRIATLPDMLRPHVVNSTLKHRSPMTTALSALSWCFVSVHMCWTALMLPF